MNGRERKAIWKKKCVRRRSTRDDETKTPYTSSPGFLLLAGADDNDGDGDDDGRRKRETRQEKSASLKKSPGGGGIVLPSPSPPSTQGNAAQGRACVYFSNEVRRTVQEMEGQGGRGKGGKKTPSSSSDRRRKEEEEMETLIASFPLGPRLPSRSSTEEGFFQQVSIDKLFHFRPRPPPKKYGKQC